MIIDTVYFFVPTSVSITIVYKIPYRRASCMQDTFARATHSDKRVRDDRVSSIQSRAALGLRLHRVYRTKKLATNILVANRLRNI